MKKSEVIANINPLVFKGIAHRGYHNDEYTENGMKAFKHALDNNLAFELDIHITKDNQLVVCHDSELKRTTGKEGIIEHLTLEEIRNNYKLLDGGDVPLLKEVFDLLQEKVPLVIELKVYEKNYKPLAAKLREFLDENVKDKKNYMLISFDPRSIIPFKNYGIMRSLLVCLEHKWVYKLRHLFESVDLDQKMFDMKNVKSYHKKHLVNCWTITSKEQLERVKPYIDLVTFQEMDHKVVEDMMK